MAKKKKNFEEALSRMEEIVSKLENEEILLEESIALYKEGMELSLFCKEKLQDAKKQITMVTKDEAGQLTETPFLAEEEAYGV